MADAEGHGARHGNSDRLVVTGLRWGVGQAVAEHVLGAGCDLRWRAAVRTSHEVCRGGASEAQSAAWAANMGHDRPFL